MSVSKRKPGVEPDHLILAARDLDSGSGWLEEHFGVVLAAGGKHVRMGTHNRLLGLGENFYLELIAIDPQAPPPDRPRWFCLDQLVLPADRPRLIHWVARSADIQSDAAGSTEPLGEILSMERGDYRWRISVPADGHLPGDGLVPTLIQWEVPFHPTERLSDKGCRLMKLEGFHPQPAYIRAALASLDLGSRLDVHPCADGEPAQLVAYIRTPRGLVELD
ncbi:MAG: VOC family protein [Betaproteobacteria bacterium]|nr:VOC family protein [Betaproteobacteria bacterium]